MVQREQADIVAGHALCLWPGREMAQEQATEPSEERSDALVLFGATGDLPGEDLYAADHRRRKALTSLGSLRVALEDQTLAQPQARAREGAAGAIDEAAFRPACRAAALCRRHYASATFDKPGRLPSARHAVPLIPLPALSTCSSLWCRVQRGGMAALAQGAADGRGCPAADFQSARWLNCVLKSGLRGKIDFPHRPLIPAGRKPSRTDLISAANSFRADPERNFAESWITILRISCSAGTRSR